MPKNRKISQLDVNQMNVRTFDEDDDSWRMTIVSIESSKFDELLEEVKQLNKNLIKPPVFIDRIDKLKLPGWVKVLIATQIVLFISISLLTFIK